ncbi:MAG: glycosyltransferase family 9 protein [Elusimicrobia bacterium]|nr:glycosyltransferase family 9 protein [Elusimicrobiota bacterium]
MKTKIRGDEKILIIQFRPHGDVLLTSPVAEYLKKRYPSLKIFFLVYEGYSCLIERNPFIDGIIAVRKPGKGGLCGFFRYLSAVRDIKRGKFDIILDYIGRPSSAIISFLSGVKARVGYGNLRGRKYLYSIRAPYDSVHKYTVLRKYDLIKPIVDGIGEPLLDARIYIDARDREYAEKVYREMNIEGRFNVLLSPDSPRKYKRWSFDCYCEVSKALISEYGACVIILHGPGEKEYCLKLREAVGRGAYLLPETSVMQAAAIVEKASLAVLNCGGIKHISVAVRTPSITLFGKTLAADWHPPGAGWARYLSGDYSGKDDTFGIGPGDVLGKIKEMIDSGAVSLNSHPAG